MLQHSNSANELMMRRKLEDEQQAAEFQHAVELQSRRLMSLQLLDLKSRVAAAAAASTAMTPTTTVANASTTTSQPGASTSVESQPDSGMHYYSDWPICSCQLLLTVVISWGASRSATEWEQFLCQRRRQQGGIDGRCKPQHR
jgi:hypothetical protein